MNKEEALRCLEISKTKYSQGNSDAALKFVKKSLHLFETENAKTWVGFALSIFGIALGDECLLPKKTRK